MSAHTDPVERSAIRRIGFRYSGLRLLAAIIVVAMTSVLLSAAHVQRARAATCPGVIALPDTSAVDTATGDAVVVHQWQIGDLNFSQAVPPAGWTPLTATDEELALFGFPARPTAPDGLNTWRAEFSNGQYTGFTPVDAATVCPVPALGSSPAAFVLPDTDPIADPLAGATNSSTSATSANWGGVIVPGSNITYTSAQYVEPTASYCAGSDPSAHSMWVGLGGTSKGHPLLQNGTAQEGTLGSDVAWYEALDSAHDTHQVNLSSFSVSSGNSLVIHTQYFPGASPKVTWYWHNLSTGAATSVSANDSNIAGNIDSYYDGTSGEVIDERPTYFSSSSSTTGYFTQMRHHSVMDWRSAVIAINNGSTHAVRDTNHTFVTMRDNAADTLHPDPNQTILERPSLPSGSASSAFNDNWTSCGFTQSGGG